ncbi:hypothetical protein CASFOL_022411 [Castilleja foliolosa]|uniref:F-box domain-containing protein n=1 Tax=Castilleja foliolosa TaxID=1961234 RepID=A0ABD3CX53_9LAMI
MDYGNAGQIKKAKPQCEKEESINVLDRLPLEIANDTLSRLPIKSLVQLSYSCRSLKSLSHDPDFVSLHLSKSSMNESECLIFHSAYPLRDQLHFIFLSDKKVRKINIPITMSIPEFYIIGSSNGLLCLVDTLFPDSFCIYNPFRRGHLEIPKNSEFKDRVVAYGFGFDPITNDYKVIMIAGCTSCNESNDVPVSDVQIYSVKSSVWQNKGSVPYSIGTWSKRGVLASGRLHWVSRGVEINGDLQRNIVTYNLANDSFDVIYGPTPASLSRWRWAPSYLGELDGCLSVVVRVRIGNAEFDVWTLRDYGGRGSWVKAYNIGTYHQVPRGVEGLRSLPVGVLKRIWCVMRSGELLLEYMGRGNNNLVTYDPRNKTFKRLDECLGIREVSDSLLHVGALTSAAFPLL